MHNYEISISRARRIKNSFPKGAAASSRIKPRKNRDDFFVEQFVKLSSRFISSNLSVAVNKGNEPEKKKTPARVTGVLHCFDQR